MALLSGIQWKMVAATFQLQHLRVKYCTCGKEINYTKSPPLFCWVQKQRKAKSKTTTYLISGAHRRRNWHLRKESRPNSLRYNKEGFFFPLYINDYSLAYKNGRWERAHVLKTTLYFGKNASSKATLCSCKDNESRMLKAFCYSFCFWTEILKAEQHQENRGCSQGQNRFTWWRAATSLALWLDAGFAVLHQFVSSPYVQIDGTPSWLTYRSYCTSFPKASRGLRTTNKWRGTQTRHHPWLYETRMLKLGLRCTGTTSYDSNQQLSLQATINPSALLMKPDATSVLPEHPAAAEDSPGRSLLPTEDTAAHPRAPSSCTFRKEGSNTERGCRESMQSKATGCPGFLQPALEARKGILPFNMMHFYLAQFLCVSAKTLPCSWLNSKDEEQNAEKLHTGDGKSNCIQPR